MQDIIETENGYEVKHYVASQLRYVMYLDKNKVCHREDGPAQIFWDLNGIKTKEVYMIDGKPKNKQEKAVFFKDGGRRS